MAHIEVSSDLLRHDISVKGSEIFDFNKIMELFFVGNPQLITLPLLSTHDLWVNWQINPHSHVIVIQHFDKIQQLFL